MIRTIDQWRGMKPLAVMEGSTAQTLYCLTDAKAEILALHQAASALLAEFEKFSRYGSPIGRGATEAVQVARLALRSPGARAAQAGEGDRG